MKLRRPALLTLALWIGLALSAPAQQPKASTHHSLWMVQGKSNVVYLLGSVHVLRAENYPLPKVIESAYSNSAIVAFETDIGAMEDPATQMKVMTKAALPNGESLQGQLSPTVYTNFIAHLESAGLPAAVFESLKPSIAAVTLAAVDLQKQGFDPEYGLDKHFYGLAHKQGKEIAMFESLDFQINLLTDCSKEEGELLMKATLEDIDTLKTELGKLLKAWETGDADTLDKILTEAAREAPAIYKRLFSDRNARWVPKIQEWMRGGKNVIVIVGAGHLVGKDGVVETLRKSGARVQQL